MPIRKSLKLSPKQRLELLFLLEKLGHTRMDYYVLNMAEALLYEGHNITIYTLCATQSQHEGLEQFKIEYFPNQILEFVFGRFNQLMLCLKALWSATRIIMYPPDPKPDLIIVNTNSVVLPLLKYFGKYKLIYLYPFEEFPCVGCNYDVPITIRNRVTASTALFSDAILVESNYLRKIYQMSYPEHQCVNVIYPPRDVYKFAKTNNISEIKLFLKTIKKNKVIFSVFGDYKKSSCHEIILDAMEWMETKSDSIFKVFIHLVICGVTNEALEEQNVYFNMLHQHIQGSSFKENVTLCRLASPDDRSTIIAASFAVIYPPRFEGHPGCLLETMCLQKPIIASRHGAFFEFLTDRYTAILIEFTSKKLVRAMYKLIINKKLRETLAYRACQQFMYNYNYSIYCKSVKALVVGDLNKSKKKGLCLR